MNANPNKITTLDLDRICDDSLHFILPVSMECDGVKYAWKVDIKFNDVQLRQVFLTAAKDIKTDYQNNNRPHPDTDKADAVAIKKARIKANSNKIIDIKVGQKFIASTPTFDEMIAVSSDDVKAAAYMKIANDSTVPKNLAELYKQLAEALKPTKK